VGATLRAPKTDTTEASDIKGEYGREHGWVARVHQKSTDVRRSGFKNPNKKPRKTGQNTPSTTLKPATPHLRLLNKSHPAKTERKTRKKQDNKSTITQRARGRNNHHRINRGEQNSTILKTERTKNTAGALGN